MYGQFFVGQRIYLQIVLFYRIEHRKETVVIGQFFLGQRIYLQTAIFYRIETVS